jgi:hypothetical protein
MIETKEIVINGSIYAVTQMPARRALKLQAKLMKILAPCASEIIIAYKDKGNEDSHIPKAVSYLVNELDDRTFDSLILEMIEYYVRKNGVELKANVFDIEFAGKLNELFLLLKFILEVNYGDFFLENGIIPMIFPEDQETETQVTTS